MLTPCPLELRPDRLQDEVLHGHALERSERLELCGFILRHADYDILARAECIGALSARARPAATGRGSRFPLRTLHFHLVSAPRTQAGIARRSPRSLLDRSAGTRSR